MIGGRLSTQSSMLPATVRAPLMNQILCVIIALPTDRFVPTCTPGDAELHADRRRLSFVVFVVVVFVVPHGTILISLTFPLFDSLMTKRPSC